jgi:hypothetical protein
MSYDKKTGVFNLTQTKARSWCQRPDAPKAGTIEYSEKLLRDAGLESRHYSNQLLEGESNTR